MIKRLIFFAAIIFLLNIQFLSAQQNTPNINAQQLELKKAVLDHRRILDDKINELKKRQKELETKKKNLVKVDDDLNLTIEKIAKLEAANQKIENKILTTSISDEEIQRQRVKSKENELTIQKLKLTQITQQKELGNAMSTL